jgi:hypothetical protein
VPPRPSSAACRSTSAFSCPRLHDESSKLMQAAAAAAQVDARTYQQHGCQPAPSAAHACTAHAQPSSSSSSSNRAGMLSPRQQRAGQPAPSAAHACMTKSSSGSFTQRQNTWPAHCNRQHTRECTTQAPYKLTRVAQDSKLSEYALNTGSTRGENAALAPPLVWWVPLTATPGLVGAPNSHPWSGGYP